MTELQQKVVDAFILLNRYQAFPRMAPILVTERFYRLLEVFMNERNDNLGCEISVAGQIKVRGVTVQSEARLETAEPA